MTPDLNAHVSEGLSILARIIARKVLPAETALPSLMTFARPEPREPIQPKSYRCQTLLNRPQRVHE